LAVAVQTKLFPSETFLHHFAEAVLRPSWFALAILAFVSLVLLMLGCGGAYSRMVERTGVVGFLGLVTIELAYLFQLAKVTWEACIYPLLARNAGAAQLLVDRAFLEDPGVAVFRQIASGAIFIGIVLFSIALFRSRIFSRIAGLLFFLGAVMYGVGPMISITLNGRS
jgi:hypothetical protein